MSATKRFEKLQEDIFNGKTNFDAEFIIKVIKDYVNEIHATKNKFVLDEMKAAPALTRIRVYDYEPGTGRATTQFYKFAKAIHNGKVTSNNISVESLLRLLATLYFDEIE